MDGDAEANYAHFALQQLGIRPMEFVDMIDEEKAFIIASIDIRIDAEKKEAARIKK